MHCRICRRPLTNPVSVRMGIGPVCRVDKYCASEIQGELFMAEAIENFRGDVICSRNETGIATNIPRRVVKHSPDGFEWGYGGSGPADFALNILSVFIGQEAAEKNGLYQDFKWKFISPLPYEGGIIKRWEILNWIKDKSGHVGAGL